MSGNRQQIEQKASLIAQGRFFVIPDLAYGGSKSAYIWFMARQP
jgi:hypothetical protein